eukprot:gb/GECG01001846.1/.p1 GENE.gb/GECG01001846.1/~~gb/GECG01001846.1/.p1  ORF type:complete len:193 (+),score=17.08 gb/GECG01001846.1/:1-579(+)
MRREAFVTALITFLGILRERCLAAPMYVDIFQPGQVWKGEYLCSQGWTSLELEITKTKGNTVDANFNYYHEDSKCGGSYEVEGVLPKFSSKKLNMEPTGVIFSNDCAYTSVGLTGDLDTKRMEFAGTISTHLPCGTFFLKLTVSKATPSASPSFPTQDVREGGNAFRFTVAMRRCSGTNVSRRIRRDSNSSP